MKKLLAVALGLALIAGLAFACFGAGSAARKDAASGDYFYALRPDGTAEITGYRGQAEELALPAVLNGHAVAAIGDYAFAWCASLAELTLPEALAAIAENAFDGSGQLSLSVSQGSFAADYCARHNLAFTCWDAPEAPAL